MFSITPKRFRPVRAATIRSLQQIYQQENRYLLGVALRIVRQRQQAEDVLHDPFMNIWTKSASFNAAAGSGRCWV